MTALHLPGVLEPGRAAPAKGVHVYEVGHEAARSKFEAVKKFTVAAMFLLIPHQTAPLCGTLEAPLPTLRGAVCLLESSNARERRISGRNRFALLPQLPAIVQSALGRSREKRV
jgi:hypothetical protein